METLLEVKNLETQFKQRKQILHAVNGVSFTLGKGEMLGIVGESGCGKSVTMLSMIKLLPPAARIVNGEVRFGGEDLMGMDKKEIRRIRGSEVGMIFQDPISSLNPVVKIGKQMSETLIYHKKMKKADAYKKCAELLDFVGISNARERLSEYPHQLSGGMRQRVMIAMALACEPKIVIADEPTTALDVTIQAQIVELVQSIKDKLNTSFIWITHDLGLIAGLVHRIIVMYAGFIVEEAYVDELYENPRHPYTIGLLGSIPKNEEEGKKLFSIRGAPPDLKEKPSSCPFLPRCDYALEKCAKENPGLELIKDTEEKGMHRIACWVDVREGTRK